MTSKKTSPAGKILVILIVAAGLISGATTWWNYTRFHPSTQDARLVKLDPPTVHAVFHHASIRRNATYIAWVSVRGGKEKLTGETREWKEASEGKISTEILLKKKPDAPLDTACVVTLDLELKADAD